MLKYESIDIKRIYKMQDIKFPTAVYLKITTECMLKCNFCSQAGKEKQYIKFEKIQEILKELKSLGVLYIYYTGGEPLMHKDIDKILKYGYELGFKQFIVSNGLMFARRDNVKLSRYLIGVGISLHGKPEIHNNLVGNINCFNKIVENLKLINKENGNIQININCTATKYNISKDNFEYLAKMCNKNKWKFTIARLNYIGDAIKHDRIDLNNMLEIINDLNNKGYEVNISNCIAPCTINKKYNYLTHGCGAGQTIAAIEANGDVKICASSNISIGNIYSKTFKKIWKSHKLREYKKFNWLPLQCKVCKYFLICKGGCKAELSGEYWKKMCDLTVQEKIDNDWGKIKNNSLSLNFEYIRKEKNRKYIIMGVQTRICNSLAKNIIIQIDGKKTGNDIVKNYEKQENIIKELLVTMKNDGLIEIKE